MGAEWILPLIEAFKSRPWNLMLLTLVLGGFLGLDIAQAENSSTLHQMSSQSSTQSATSDVRESFLQQFISRSLVSELPAQALPATPPEAPQARSKMPQPQVSVVEPPLGKGLSSELTAAATKMILALAAILSVLIGAAYLVRRFVINRTSYGSSEQLLRVVAKVPLSAKSMVALIEVPGKCILIGVSGTTLTPLGEIAPLSVATAPSAVTDSGEVAASSEVEPEPEPAIEIETDTVTLSFAESLKQYAQNQAIQDDPDDELLGVEEIIQKKVSNLKRL